MGKKSKYSDGIIDEDFAVPEVEEVIDKEDQQIKMNLKEETRFKKYIVLKGYEISHKGKRYKAGDTIELNDEERKLIKYGLK